MTQPLLERIRQLSSPLEPIPTNMTARLAPMANIKAVLFDVYGTLFISGSGDISVASGMSNQRACADALACSGVTGDLERAGALGSAALLQAIRATDERLKLEGVAFPEVDIREEWRVVLRDLERQGVISGELSNDLIECVSVEYEFRVNPVWPMPGMAETLRRLAGRGIALGIVSNAQFFTPLMFPALAGTSLDAFGFRPELCAWSYQLREAKPSVNLFRAALAPLRELCGITPEDALYIGNDMLNDIWTAAQCGLKTALFAGDQRSLRLRETDQCCANLQPDAILNNLLDCFAILHDSIT
ncbi:haloacid dehalogenase domain protein hydrolase [Candidatus Moduliflexus flocculans]|uniref:Haloacid dehalogenase domain protein hydrolase n=1 Tax=Candidatus Moduliflexus flocculans TaxID=1499966 RepID=A0A0S6W361_9BACT|nr:haloacid dehalogenase domain protein hydrolase [Candidatus Moduliflexus flocculans]